MSYKPDYGLRLMNSGIGRDVDQFFYDFRLYSLRVLGRGQYSTMVHLPWEGEICSLSLDFNNRQLEEILAKASPELSAFIRNEISRDPSTPRTIDFGGEVAFAVRARLGPMQVIQRESFVPLVTQQILE